MTTNPAFDPRDLDVAHGRDILPNARYVRDAAAGAAREFQRALPELVTNADAAIQKQRGSGYIWIYVHTADPQTVQVVDDGLGMDAATMERRLFQLGVLPETRAERSLFGRGLRDVLMSAQAGEVASVATDGHLYHAYFRMPSGSFLKTVWADDHGVPADPLLRQRYSLPGQGTGTSVKVWLDPRYSRLPKADRLLHVVRNLVQCRPIFEDPTRNVQLSIDGGPLQNVTYEAPVATATLLDEKVDIEGFDGISAHLTVYRSSEDFPLTKSERHIRRGGLVVRSGRAAHEATFFDFEHWEGTRHLLGSVVCDAIDQIQREALDRGESEAIVFSDRSGLNADHPFSRALARAVNAKLQPIVAAEEGDKAPTRAMAQSVKTRRERGLRELNRMAARLLQSLGKGPGARGGQNVAPPRPVVSSGGGQDRQTREQPRLPGAIFFPQPVYFIKAEQKRTITALIDGSRVPAGSEVEVILEDDGAAKVVHDLVLPPSKASVQRLKIGLRAGKTPMRTTLLLRVGTATAETEIVVQSHKQRGIFSDIRPVEQDNPYMQARFSPVSGVVDVFIGRPEFASLVRAGERAMGSPSKALDYPPYEVKEIDAALAVVYQYLAQKHQERLPENQGVPQQVLQARVLAQVEDLRYEWEAQLMKAFLSDSTYEGRVVVAPGDSKRGRTRARRRGARVSSGAVSTESH